MFGLTANMSEYSVPAINPLEKHAGVESKQTDFEFNFAQDGEAATDERFDDMLAYEETQFLIGAASKLQ